MSRADVVVVGAGHNGLVAATLLARAGLTVTVCEAAHVVGGAARTETPFRKVPGLRQSTGAYLLGLMPPELLHTLQLELPLLRRDPHYFLPMLDGRRLLFGSHAAEAQRQIEAVFSAADAAADQRLQAELAQLRADLAPAWLSPPLSIEDTAERYIRPALRPAFVDLCRGSVLEYLHRFGFASELLVAMYAVTDGLSGLAGGPDTPGSGHNFLVHNMCRLPGADGTWLIVRGGMGTVTRTLSDAATAAGAQIHTGHPVERVTTAGGAVDGVCLADGRSVAATVVLACTDPFRLGQLVDLPAELAGRLARLRRDGSTLKVNLALRELPRFPCLLPTDPPPYGATMHLLPQEQPLAELRQMWAEVQAGQLPDFPTIEWYLHTTVDPSLRAPTGHHSSALFVQSVPARPIPDSYLAQLLAICDRFAPGTSSLVDDVFALGPLDIERHFGITGGHIHHLDNGIAFADRMPYRTGVPGLYAGGAGCHPAGSVIGAAGHNAAGIVLADLG